MITTDDPTTRGPVAATTARVRVVTTRPAGSRRREVAGGDGPGPYETWVAERRPALLRAAWGITGDVHLAEDVLQAALTSVLPHWDSLSGRRGAEAYVHRAMVNHHLTWVRRPHQRLVRPVAELPETVAADRGPDEVAEGGDLGRTLWRLVAGLPPRQRAAVALRYYEGMSEAETARVLGVSVGAVKSNTSRGLASLRRAAADLELAG